MRGRARPGPVLTPSSYAIWGSAERERRDAHRDDLRLALPREHPSVGLSPGDPCGLGGRGPTDGSAGLARGAFGRGDWVANGVLFAAYHLHVPWSIPVNLLDMFIVSYPTKRYQSAWIGIAVHSAQNVFFAAVVLPLVF